MLLWDLLQRGVGVRVADRVREGASDRVVRVKVAEGEGDSVEVGLWLWLQVRPLVQERVAVVVPVAASVEVAQTVGETLCVGEGGEQLGERLGSELRVTVRVWLAVSVCVSAAPAVPEGVREPEAVRVLLTVLADSVCREVGDLDRECVALWVREAEGVSWAVQDAEDEGLGVKEVEGEPNAVVVALAVELLVRLADSVTRRVSRDVADCVRDSVPERVLCVNVREAVGEAVGLALWLWLSLHFAVVDNVPVAQRDAVPEHDTVDVGEAVGVAEGRVQVQDREKVPVGVAVGVWLAVCVAVWSTVGVCVADGEEAAVALPEGVLRLAVPVGVRDWEEEHAALTVRDTEAVVGLTVHDRVGDLLCDILPLDDLLAVLLWDELGCGVGVQLVDGVREGVAERVLPVNVRVDVRVKVGLPLQLWL